MKQQELSVLSNVIAVARRELADRDDKEIPPRIRRVARCTGKGLPPPFQLSLIQELRRNDAFRESVLERWETEGVDDAVGHAFLEDPEDGAERVTKQAETRDVVALGKQLDAAIRTNRSLEGQVAEAKSRFAEAARAHVEEVAGRDAAAEASRTSLERTVLSLTAQIAGLEAVQATHDTVVERLEAEIDDLTSKLDRSVARARKRAQKDHIGVRQPMAPPSDPVQLAAWLDAVEKQQRSFRKASGRKVDAISDRPPLRIPGGLLPDSHLALVALIDQEPDVMYIDGYNVGAMLVDDFNTARARTRVVAIAERLAAASRGRVVVVFDAVGVEGRPTIPTQGRAEVCFSHEQIADDEIVEMIRNDPSRTAVVTSDRELSNRCAALGCVTVWSEALAAWANR
jgi:hypothetical protein